MVARTLVLVIVSLTLAACDGSGSGTAAEDERGSVGPGSPAAIYCEKIGYKADGESCIFPDGTSCEQWSFYRATCGQQHSYCSRRGGTIASREVDAGDGFTAVTAICTVNGKQCAEEDFYRAGNCP
jgi:putative hemolysin